MEKNTTQYLSKLKKDIKELARTQKMYKLQSEFHRMMYAKTLEAETIAKCISKT